MLDYVGGIVGVVGGLLGIILLVATVVAYFRVSLAKATIDTLKESNAALNERVSILEQSDTRKEAQILVLSRENDILKSALSGKADVEKIVGMLEHHHSAILTDRETFEHRFTEAMVTMGNRLDSNHRTLNDVLEILGDKRRPQAT